MTAVLGSLAVLAGVLVVVGVVKGPALTGTQVNLRAAEAGAGQRLVLASDQALDESVEPIVTVEPAVPVTVAVQGTTVTVQLGAPLAYATDYTVSVRGVAGAVGGGRSDWTESFSTPDVSDLLVLRQGADGDEIVSVGAERDDEVVYRGDGIVAYAATASDLAIVQRDASSGSDVVTVVPRQGGDPTVLAFPAAGTVTSLRASPDGSMLGLTYTQPQTAFTAAGTDLLFTYDLARGGGLPELVPDERGEQISAVDWTFVPGSAQLLALTPGGRLLRVDAVDAFTGKAVATDVGAADALRGTLPGAGGVVVDDAGSLSVVTADAIAPTSWRLNGASSMQVIVDDQGSTLSASAQGALVLDRATGESSTVLPAGGDGIAAVCSSRNGLYAVVTTESGGTEVVSLSEGSVLLAVEGTDPSWC